MEEAGRWLPTRNAKYGVVTCDFFPEKQTVFLRLKFGDVVQILEENGGWYRGFTTRNKFIKGVFPASHVHIRECNVINPGAHEVVMLKEDPMAQEICDVLREWCNAWKRHYMEGKRKQFQELTDLMREMLDKRRQILSKTLPRDELKELKHKVASRIDDGNRFTGLDLIPREDSGELIDPMSSGVMHLYKVMKTMSQSVESSSSSVSHVPGTVKHTSRMTLAPSGPKKEEHHIYIKFSALALPVNEPCDLYFFLYDGRQCKALSERYMICLSQHCLPKNPDKIGQCFAVFTDLDTQDIQNKDLYLACQVIRVGNDLEGKKTAAPLRKPHGAGIFSLHSLLNSKDQLQEEQETQLDVCVCPPAEYHRLLENMIKKQGVYHQTERGTGVFIGIRVLKGPLSKVKEENPLLFRKFTAICKKLAFAEIIRPYDERHDVYLTLQQGLFSKGSKRADKNVQVDVEVYSDNARLPNCIVPGIGEENVSIYNSLVHYHQAAPVFNETIKLNIPADAMKNTRVRFNMYHKSTIISSKLSKSEPFAQAHLKLMKADDTTVEDGEHNLFVYNYKDMIKNPSRLQSLPDRSSGSLSASPPEFLHLRDTFTVVTRICSTKLTQNADLHGLLHWRTNEKRLPLILKGLQSIGGDEIVKFLADTFNALFSIIEEKKDEFGDLVFEALVFIIGLLAVEKYENFRPVLDTYCDHHFNAASVHLFLMRKMKYVFEQVVVMNGTRKLSTQTIGKTTKAAEFLFKFTMRSRLLHDEATQGKGNEQFLAALRDLLATTCNMMSMDCPEGELVAPKAQAQAMQFLPQIFPLLLSAMSIKSLAEIVADFLLMIKETKLKVYKCQFLFSVVSSDLFTQKESRVVLLPSILRHLRYHISKRDDSLDKSLDILGNMLTHMRAQSLESRQRDVNVLVKMMLQALLECFSELHTVTRDRDKDKLHPHLGVCVSNLMALTELMTPWHLNMLMNECEVKEDKEEFIHFTFHAYSELISLNHLYPTDWSALRLLHNNVMLNATQQLAQILQDEFLGDDDSVVFFNSNLWEKFFQLGVDFCCQPSLQLEKLSELKRSKVLNQYGDMRVTMNKLLLDKWSKLGSFQSRFVPHMIGPFLRLSLIPHSGLRRATVPVFFDMMEYEWKFKKSFHLMETEMIDKLDLYVSDGMGDANYRLFLHQTLTDKLTERCKGQPMEESGLHFIDSLAELLRRLLDYRAVPHGDEYRDLHMHVVFNLLNFYKSIGREQIYFRYIYRLAELHKQTGNYVEAAFTLLLHAQLLQWSSRFLGGEGTTYPRQSASDRKMALYTDVINYFDQGKLWECGIEHCKEIASQLETHFLYEKLAKIHQTISRFYTSILRDVRAEPMYFRVGFYGGFPPFLKNKVFVFRGNEFEKLPDFNARLSVTHPQAKQLKTLELPGLDIMESDEQYIQCCSVEPLPEPNFIKKFEGKEVADEITRFYHTNNVKQFVLKRPFHLGKKDKTNEYKTLHIERTVYTTEYKFPGILRWFEVVDTDVSVMNPVQNGAELIQDNITQLKTIINRVRSERQNTNPLTMKLNGTLDAAVNGGVSKFEVFFTHEYLGEYPDFKPDIPKLRELMEELGRVLTDGIALHTEVCPETMKALHERMEELLPEYLSKYGDHRSSGAYDAVSFLSVDETPRKRLLSSSRRRGNFKSPPQGDRPPTIAGSPGPEDLNSGQAPPPVPEHRNRAQTDGGVLQGGSGVGASPSHSRKPEPLQPADYDETPPRLPTKQRRSSLSSPRPGGDLPLPPPHRNASPATPNVADTVLRHKTPSSSPGHSRPTSFSSSGGDQSDEGPRPPPRLASVRVGGLQRSSSAQSGSQGSLDRFAAHDSPTASPSLSSSLPQREPIDTGKQRSVKDIVDIMSAKTDESSEAAPPPVPRKMSKMSLIKNGGSADDSSS